MQTSNTLTTDQNYAYIPKLFDGTVISPRLQELADKCKTKEVV